MRQSQFIKEEIGKFSCSEKSQAHSFSWFYPRYCRSLSLRLSGGTGGGDVPAVIGLMYLEGASAQTAHHSREHHYSGNVVLGATLRSTVSI